MTDPSLVMALITYPDGHTEAEGVLVEQLDDTTISLSVGDGLHIALEATELRRALADDEQRNAA